MFLGLLEVNLLLMPLHCILHPVPPSTWLLLLDKATWRGELCGAAPQPPPPHRLRQSLALGFCQNPFWFGDLGRPQGVLRGFAQPQSNSNNNNSFHVVNAEERKALSAQCIEDLTYSLQR